MTYTFEIEETKKSGLNYELCGIVYRGNTVYLRFWGSRARCDLATATESEDDGRFVVCADRQRVMDAARQAALNLGYAPVDMEDHRKRPYVGMCAATENEHIWKAAAEFFTIYDQCKATETEASNEMREIYDALAVDDSGEDVYLSDGVWLGSDGSSKDLGR